MLGTLEISWRIIMDTLEESEDIDLNSIVEEHIKSENYKYNPTCFGFTCGLIVANALVKKIDVDDILKGLPEEPVRWEEDKFKDSKDVKSRRNFSKSNITQRVIMDTLVAIRKDIYVLMNVINNIGKEDRSRELSLAYTAFEKSRMNIGNCLNKMEMNEDPYYSARMKRKHQGSREIAPTADTSDYIPPELKESDFLKLIDNMREEGDKILKRLESCFNNLNKSGINHNIWVYEYIMVGCTELKYGINCLGLVLSNIRNKEVV